MKYIDISNATQKDSIGGDCVPITAEQLMEQHGLTIDELRTFPLVEGINGHIHASAVDMSDPQKLLEIEYRNSMDAEMAKGIRDILHRFHVRKEGGSGERNFQTRLQRVE